LAALLHIKCPSIFSLHSLFPLQKALLITEKHGKFTQEDRLSLGWGQQQHGFLPQKPTLHHLATEHDKSEWLRALSDCGNEQLGAFFVPVFQGHTSVLVGIDALEAIHALFDICQEKWPAKPSTSASSCHSSPALFAFKAFTMCPHVSSWSVLPACSIVKSCQPIRLWLLPPLPPMPW